MEKDHVDSDHLRVTGRHAAVPHVDVMDGVVVIVTQAFGPCGDNLVGISGVEFDGHPAVTLGVRVGDREELVHLSPIHGDDRKSGLSDLPVGTRCQLYCPVSREPLPFVGNVEDGSGAGYYALYLTPQLAAGSTVMVSDLWGHYHSRIIDDFELISHWAAHEAATEASKDAG